MKTRRRKMRIKKSDLSDHLDEAARAWKHRMYDMLADAPNKNMKSLARRYERRWRKCRELAKAVRQGKLKIT